MPRTGQQLEPLDVSNGQMDILRARLAEEQLAEGVHEALSAAIMQMQTPFNMLNAALEMLQRRVSQQHADEPLLAVLLAVREQGLATLEKMRQSLPERVLAEASNININSLIHGVLLARTERLLAAGIVIDWQPTSPLPPVHGWEAGLRCLLTQLLDNAIEAIGQRRDSERVIHIETVENNSWLQLVIHDSGPGIAESERLKVFEPFYSQWARGTRRHAGMGLGMVQEVINQHGATLEIDPQADGCRVVVHFPLPNGKAV